MALKILILLPRIPFPLRDGGAIAMNQTLEELSKQDCEVSVLAMNTARHYVEEVDLPSWYQRLKHFERVYVDNRINPLSAFFNLFSGQSYNISRFINREYSKRLSAMLEAENYDIVLFESIYTSHYLKEVQEQSNAKCFCRVHNVEYLIWQRLSEHEKSFVKRKYLELLTERLKNYELQVLKEFDLLLPISKKEEKFFLEHKINSSYYLPFGITLQEPEEVVQEKGSLYHIGSMDWAPNLEGVEWFLNEVWNHPAEDFPGMKLYLAGKNMPKPIQEKQNEQVIVSGEVEDLFQFSSNKEMMLVPLLSGAGIRVKVLEAMAMGKAIIATPMAVEGIGMVEGRDIILAETAEDFREKIKYYAGNDELRREVEKNAKRFVHEHYNKEKLYQELVIGFKHIT